MTHKPVQKPPQKPAGQRPPAQGAQPAPGAPADLNVNKPGEWAQLQNDWMKVQMEKAQAQADKFFTTDEELPLSAHILLVTIIAVFFAFIIWANFATLDEVTRGDGKIIPSSQVQIIQNLEGGIID